MGSPPNLSFFLGFDRFNKNNNWNLSLAIIFPAERVLSLLAFWIHISCHQRETATYPSHLFSLSIFAWLWLHIGLCNVWLWLLQLKALKLRLCRLWVVTQKSLNQMTVLPMEAALLDQFCSHHMRPEQSIIFSFFFYGRFSGDMIIKRNKWSMAIIEFEICEHLVCVHCKWRRLLTGFSSNKFQDKL